MQVRVRISEQISSDQKRSDPFTDKQTNDWSFREMPLAPGCKTTTTTMIWTTTQQATTASLAPLLPRVANATISFSPPPGPISAFFHCVPVHLSICCERYSSASRLIAKSLQTKGDEKNKEKLHGSDMPVVWKVTLISFSFLQRYPWAVRNSVMGEDQLNGTQ